MKAANGDKSFNFNSRAYARRDRSQPCFLFHHFISTHAPTQGATQENSGSSDKTGFQLTRPRKARRCSNREYHIINLISTHAPTQGATASWRRCLSLDRFQLTRPRKARHYADRTCDVAAEFQLTRPRKARPSLDRCIYPNISISTHAPTQGATQCGNC